MKQNKNPKTKRNLKHNTCGTSVPHFFYLMARQKKIQREPKSKLGLNDKLHICYNCMFYGPTGWCPWEKKFMNYT